MKKIILLIIFLINSNTSFSQKDLETLFTINGEKTSVKDFKIVYEKNLNAIDNEESKNVETNLDLFINFKLKVKEAYELKLDTLESYKNEIETYKNQLIAPYLQDKKYLNLLIKEAYDRTKTEVQASHILIRLPQNYSSKDTLNGYNKIIKARNRVIAGEPFNKVAKEMSEDPSAKENGGDLGFFSAFKMLYDFEDVAYKTKVGEVSKPFKTRYGYHFIKNTGFRTSLGERQVAHILITDTTTSGKLKMDLIYSKLREGIDFTELTKQYSNDINSKNKGGVLPKFGTGRMVKSFENVVFSLKNINDYSLPFRTKYGWHIVKLLKKYPVLSFDEIKNEISERVRKTGRTKLSDNAVLNRLKKEYSIKINESAKKVIERENIKTISNDSLQDTLLIINQKIIPQSDFISYISNKRYRSINKVFDNFVDFEILAYFKENLVNTNLDFANTLKEYEDGLLLFELMQKKIWNMSSDSIGLINYFEVHKNKYGDKELESIKGRVMNDYQQLLDEEWILSLRSSNNIKTDKKVLKKLIKYYRKEF